MIDVVHLMPHFSGGLASVLLSTLKYAEQFAPHIRHEIVTFDAVDPETLARFAAYSDQLRIHQTPESVAARVAAADIVHFEWWNHPRTYQFLSQFEFPPVRMLVCCHVSGLCRPQIITRGIVEFADLFVAVTRASGRHPIFDAGHPRFDVRDQPLREKLRFVRFPADMDRFQVNRSTRADVFHVGYVGTVNYSKLHRNFLSMSASVDVPNVKFTVCGRDDVDQIEAEAARVAAPGRFHFLGFQESIDPVLNSIDVFGYPLVATHFGSGEQAIVEAMYFGVPVVAFANAAEKEIVEHGVTGFLAESEEEYVGAIEYLHRHPERRLQMGANARAFVQRQLSPAACFEDFGKLYDEILSVPKRSRRLRTNGGGPFPCYRNDPLQGAKLCIESLGDDASEFLASLGDGSAAELEDAERQIGGVESAMTTRTKGSLNQYLHFFPEDPALNYWVGLVRHRQGLYSDAVHCFDRALRSSVYPLRVRQARARSAFLLESPSAGGTQRRTA